MNIPENISKNNILIVDDTPDNLSVLRQLLTEKGFLVRPALSGEIALKAIKTQVPDIILLDIIMPEMDGYEVCHILKSDAKTAHIPIIFISALTEAKGIIKAFEAGGVDYITKPFRTEEVMARVQTHLDLQKCHPGKRSVSADVADYSRQHRQHYCYGR